MSRNFKMIAAVAGVIALFAVAMVSLLSSKTDNYNVSSQTAPLPSDSGPVAVLTTESRQDRITTTDQPSPDNATVENSAKPILALQFESLNDFIDYIENTNPAAIDIDPVIDFISRSNEGFEFIEQALWRADTAYLRQLYLHAIHHADRNDKLELAAELSRSEDPSERKMAYEWLSYSFSEDPANPLKFQDALATAIETESDIDLLNDLMDILKNRSDDVSLDRVSSRIAELSYHENEKVAINAILTSGRIDQSQDTADFLISHIDTSTEERQIAAIKSLQYFRRANETILDKLNSLMSNPSVPQNVRAAAVRAIVSFENYANQSGDAGAVEND